jgi:hypothetical protein
MLPHPQGEDVSISGALHECTLGLKDIPLDDLDENARRSVATLNRLMDTTDINDTKSVGAWRIKAQQLSVDEKRELSHAVDELAWWFGREDDI